ncbi:MAG: hypothetical protein KC561_19180, partial [Myxococcales bacterium]|nr:hypothetical protein [Myxococcales bacterium]
MGNRLFIISMLALSATHCSSDLPLAGDLPSQGSDGSACDSDSDCLGGVCLTEVDSQYPGGYCTRFFCEVGDCNGGRCAELDGRQSQCVDLCARSVDCRDGYACESLDDSGTLGCVPRLLPSAGEPNESGACVSGCSNEPVRIECGFTPIASLGEENVFVIPFEVPTGADGFSLSAWGDPTAASSESAPVAFVRAENSSGEVLLLNGVDAPINLASFFPNNDIVTLGFPLAPRYEDFTDTSGGSVRLESTAEQLCLARSASTGDDRVLRIRLVAATSSVNAEDVLDDTDFQAALELIGQIFEPAFSLEIVESTTLESGPNDG